MNTLPMDERPRERCLRAGPASLSLRELLAVLLGTGPRGEGCLGLATRILDTPGFGLPDREQEKAFFTAMESPGAVSSELPGLGEAGRARILAAVELGRRYVAHRNPPLPRAPRKSSRAEVLSRVSPALRSSDREWLGFVPVSRTRSIGQLCLVEQGVRTHVNTDPAELFGRVLALRPAGFYLLHNHPSGSLDPSQSDHTLTRQVASLAAQLGVQLMGHAIVSLRGSEWIVV